MRLKYLIFVFVFISINKNFSQELQIDGLGNQAKEIWKEKYKINGGVTANNVYLYNPTIVGANKESNIYTLTANLNLKLFKYIDLPFTYSYSNANSQSAFTNPSFSFNRFYIAPKYKKWALQIGQNISVSFSPQTLSGLPFTGASLEYNGEKLNGQILYGKFLDAIKEDTLSTITPSYQRLGFGIKTSYTNNDVKLEWMIFSASDEKNSIPLSKKNINLKPQAGTQSSFLFAFPIARHFSIDGEYHFSAFTTNLLDSSKQSNVFLNSLPFTNASTNILSSFKVGPKIKIRKINLGMSYERVEPNFKSIGNLNLMNDFQNLLITIATPLFKNKFTMSGSIGLNYTDIYNRSTASNQKIIYQLSVNYPISSKWNLNLSYNNNQILHIINPIAKAQLQNKAIQSGEVILLDTLNNSLINSTYNGILNYNNSISNKYSHSFTISTNFTDAYKLVENVLNLGDLTRTIINNISYNFNQKKINLSISPACNIIWSYTALLTQLIFSPSLNISKKIFKNKITVINGYSFNQINANNGNNNTFSIRVGMSFVVLKKHHFNFNTNLIYKNLGLPTETNNLNLNLNYSYAF